MFCVTVYLAHRTEPRCPRRPPVIEMLVAEVSSDCKYMQVRVQSKKNAVIAEGKEGKKMFLGRC